MNEPFDNTDAPTLITVEDAFRQWRLPLCRFVRRLAYTKGLPDSQACADDLVQQVFVAAMSTNWDRVRYPRAWLYTVARHMVLAVARQPQYLADQPAHSVVTWSSMTRLTSLMNMAGARRAAELVQSLPDRRAQVAYLRLFLGWDYASIADELNMDSTTARVHLRKARITLSEELEREIHGALFEDHLPMDIAGPAMEGVGPDFWRRMEESMRDRRLRSQVRRRARLYCLAILVICAALTGVYLLLS